jgi:hypothetical protein
MEVGTNPHSPITTTSMIMLVQKKCKKRKEKKIQVSNDKTNRSVP